MTAADTMVSAGGIVPWHKAQTGDRTRVVSGRDAATAGTFIALGGIDWTVSRRGLFLADGTPVPSHVALIRDDTGEQLSIVSVRYTEVQNRDAFTPMDAFVRAGYGTFETCGSLHGGRNVYLSIRANAPFEVLPGDPVESYLVLTSGHDGESSVRAVYTATRPVCENTIRLGREMGRNVFSLRHTKNVAVQLEQATADYMAVVAKAEKMRVLFSRMAARKIDHAGLIEYVRECAFPDAPRDAAADSDGVFAMLGGIEHIAARAQTAAEKRREAIVDRICELADHGRGTDIPGVRGSLWGAYNAVTEYASHEYPVRGDTTLTQSILAGAAGELMERAITAAAARVA